MQGPNMKALVLQKPGHASIESIPGPVITHELILLKVRMVGFCGSDLNSFRGLNPLVSFPRIPGHEVCATVVDSGRDGGLAAGTDVALSPYTSCGECASCRRGRPNACGFNQTLGVQRDGALTEFIVMPRRKVICSRTHTRKNSAWLSPLRLGFHAVARRARSGSRYGRNPGLRRSGVGGHRCFKPLVVRPRSALTWTTKSWRLRDVQVALTPSTLGKKSLHERFSGKSLKVAVPDVNDRSR